MNDVAPTIFPELFTLSAGPSGSTYRTQSAMCRPLLYHYDPDFLELYADTVGLLGKAFGSDQAPVVLQGEAVLGLEAAAASVISSNDVVLNLVTGVFSKGFGFWARRYAKEVIELEVPFDEVITAEQVRQALSERPEVSVVAACHCETPSGTVTPLDEIGPVVENHGALLVVDAVSSFGGIEIDLDRWGADLVVVGPQKCLGGPPGLSLIYVSEKAWDHMAKNPLAPRASILSILDWRDAHLVDHPFPFTPSVAEIYGLEACLRQYLEEGPERVRARHRQAGRAARAAGQALGLELWPKDPTTCSDTVTAFKVPKGLDEREVRGGARRDLGVMLSGGQGSLAGKVLRIGHMGPAAYPLGSVLAVTALGHSLRSFGVVADIGGAVEAAVAALAD